LDCGFSPVTAEVLVDIGFSGVMELNPAAWSTPAPLVNSSKSKQQVKVIKIDL
jgi:hypothetical protein